MEEDSGYMLRDGGCTSTHYSVMRCQGTKEGSTKVVRRIMVQIGNWGECKCYLCGMIYQKGQGFPMGTLKVSLDSGNWVK